MIQYPENYFEDEIRCDFRITKLMKKYWAAQLDVLEEVDRICKKYNLKYFLWDGSMIGAVRHKGYIPWDDDLDIAMKRPDYIKLMSVLSKEMPEGYRICSMYNDPDWCDTFSRVVNTDRIPISEEKRQKFHDCPFSAGIDIFPLDLIPRDKELARVQKDLLNLAWRMITNLMRKESGLFSKEDEKIIDKECIESLKIFAQFCSIPNMEGKSAMQIFHLIFEQLSMLANESTSDEYACVSTFGDHGYAVTYKKHWLSDTVQFPFEYSMVPVPIGYDAILQTHYNNYMKYVRLASCHAYPCYIKQIRVLQKRGLWDEDEKCDPQDVGILDSPRVDIDKEWLRDLEQRIRSEKNNKKTIVLLQLNQTSLLRWEEDYLRHMDLVCSKLVSDDRVFVIWVSHENDNTPYKMINPDLFSSYLDLLKKYEAEKNVLIDRKNGYKYILSIFDIYLGEEGDVSAQFNEENKHSFFLNFRGTDNSAIIHDLYKYTI